MAKDTQASAEAQVPDAHEARLALLEQKVASLENHGHEIPPESIVEISEHAFQRVIEHLRKAFGHSGLPSA